jgi:methionyl-tRNA formyltransferase
MDKIRVVFMGTPEFSVPVLQGLIDNYNVVGVVTQPDKEVGRHKELEASPIKKLAIKNNIPVVQPVKVRNEYQCVLDFKPDIIVTCAYGQIIPT